MDYFITVRPGILLDIDQPENIEGRIETASGEHLIMPFTPEKLALDDDGHITLEGTKAILKCSRAVFTFTAIRGARLYKANPGWAGRLIMFDRHDPTNRAFIPYAVFWMAVEAGFTLFSGYDAGHALVARQ